VWWNVHSLFIEILPTAVLRSLLCFFTIARGGARCSLLVPLPPHPLSCSFTHSQISSIQVLPPFRIGPLARSLGT
jgi:hypothetical protein